MILLIQNSAEMCSDFFT